MHLAAGLGVRDDEAFQAAYWKAFEEFFGPNNAPVVKAMMLARNAKADTGKGEIDRVCFGLRQTMSWLAEAVERRALASVGLDVTKPSASASKGAQGRSPRARSVSSARTAR